MRSFVIVRYPKWISYQHHNLWMLNKNLPEIESSVSEDTQNRNSKALIQTFDSVLGHNFSAAVEKTVELSFSFWLSNIGSESCSCEIKWIDENQTEATSDTSRQQWSDEILSLVGYWINTLQEDSV